MEMCRCIREKEEMEKILRHHISAQAFEDMFHVSDRALHEVQGGTFDGIGHSQTRNVEDSDHYIDDFDDMSSYQGLTVGDEVEMKTSDHTTPVKSHRSLNQSDQLNISDISNSGILSLPSGVPSSNQRDESDSRHSRRSRGASVPLNKRGVLAPFVAHTSYHRVGGSIGSTTSRNSPKSSPIHARVVEVLNGRSSVDDAKMMQYFEK